MITQEEIKNITDSVKYNLSGVETILDQKLNILETLNDFEGELDKTGNRIEFLTDTKAYYVKAVDIMYQESIGALKETLDAALQYVITDKNYSCNLTLDDKRGSKYLYISVVDNDEGVELMLKHGMGQGVRAVISFVLKAFYLINQDSRVLMIDEKYSTLSNQYIARFFEFIKGFCEKNDFIIVSITHDPRFMDYGDKCFLVNDGSVQETEIGESVVLGQK